MNSRFISIVLSILFVLPAAFLQSCHEEDVPEASPTDGMTKVGEAYALGAGARLELWSVSGLTTGYNQLYIAAYDSITGAAINDSHIHIHPHYEAGETMHSCPVFEPDAIAVDGLFPIGIVFTDPADEALAQWEVNLRFHNHNNNKFGKAVYNVSVKQHDPVRIHTFETEGGDHYCLSYVLDGEAKVGVNTIKVFAFRMEEGEFVPAEDLVIDLNPEMPSMGHGSPNNVDPTLTSPGIYEGKVNFTMSGAWSIHLDISDGDLFIGTKAFDVVVP
jgi:hypothetical protein